VIVSGEVEEVRVGRAAAADGEDPSEGHPYSAGAPAASSIAPRHFRPTQPLVSSSGPSRSTPTAESDRAPAPPRWIDELAPPGLALLFVAGKGGVGKSTCAAALALAAARRRPERRVELLSIDPAHSLVDVLGLGGGPAGDTAGPAGLPPNLTVRELDAAAAFAARRDELLEALDELWAAAGDRRAGADATFDRRILERLVDGIPPGLDELIAMVELTAASQDTGEPPTRPPPSPSGPDAEAPVHPPPTSPFPASEPPLPSASPGTTAPRLIVVDTAPTGHLLRLLETPELALAWSRALMEVLLRYRQVTGLGRLARELVELSRGTRALQAALGDPARTRFAVVTRAAELPRRETVRLLATLGRRRLAVTALVVDAVWPAAAGGRSAPKGAEGCPRCAARAAAEAHQLDRLRRAAAKFKPPAGAPRCAILLAPAAWPPPIGVAALIRWLRRWRREDPPIENPPNEMD
jgi:arsenite-transporting ATPase